MKKYRIEAEAKVRIVTIVEAGSYEEAEKIAQCRNVDICIHGSEFCDKKCSEEDFTLIDGEAEGFKIDIIDKV